jgi:hypothetical protein
MKNCQKCTSSRIANLCAKCSDLCCWTDANVDHEGYVPSNVGIGSDDYVEFDYCLDCGQIQGTFPITNEAVEAIAERD